MVVFQGAQRKKNMLDFSLGPDHCAESLKIPLQWSPVECALLWMGSAASLKPRCSIFNTRRVVVRTLIMRIRECTYIQN